MAVVRESFFADGVFYAAGDVVDDKSPVVKGREALFDRAPARVEPVVEQATAAPGEKRTTPTRARKPKG